ncbi:hypothetical protein AGMMS49928_11030 [Spirochaetia bacterium]|nr:hypothetical protein AGMMS49928_11030 [Spirochaetia bacterium]
MAFIKNFFISLLTSGKYTRLQDEKDMEAVLRLIIINITYTAASIVIITMGASSMQSGKVDQGLIDLIIGFAVFLNLMLLRTEFPFIVGGFVVTLIFGAFCGVSLYTKDDSFGFASLWVYTYPLMSIFTLGFPLGLIPALVLFAAVAIGIFTPGLAAYQYTIPEAFLTCGLYFFFLLLTVVYEYARSLKDHWLSRQDSYMQMVFANSPDIILLLDNKGALVYSADVFLRRAHIRNFEDIRKRSYREVFARFTTPEKLKEIIDFFADSKMGKKPVVIERSLDIGNDGNSRYYEIHFTPMYNKEEIFQGAFVLFHDMTDILEARDMAEQASRAKSNFLANMSHEIRTPLNAVIGMTAIAKNAKEAERKDYCLGKIEGASTHLLGIINDILDMSKIEEDKFELSPTDFEFNSMIQRVITIFEFRLSEKNQKLSVFQDPSIPPRIIGDEQRLAQVITNLMGNAVKFTPDKGTITLGIRRLPDSAPGFCDLEIKVTDTGIGISKDQQDKLFQSFVQVDSSIARKFGGTGLGLAISKKIVEKMQGNIRIESEAGKGSSFIFTIRAEIPAADYLSEADLSAEKSGAAPQNAGEANEEADFTGKRILLAEDVDINREIVVTVLEPLGLSITEAENGREAFDTFAANPENFDLIFMDLHMPGIDGYESTRLIRAIDHPQAKIIPIIAMTANVFKEDVERCLAVGMNNHLGKPLDFDAVMAILKEYLGNKS